MGGRQPRARRAAVEIPLLLVVSPLTRSGGEARPQRPPASGGKPPLRAAGDPLRGQ